MTEIDRIAEIVAALEAGEPVVIPTDTVYGLAARAADGVAVAKLFAIKERPVDKQMAVLVADVAQAQTLVEVGPEFLALTARFWPGPLTVVARRRDGATLAAGDEHTLGVRCPDDDLVRALAAAVGPLAATSANRSGHATPSTAADVARQLPAVALVIDGGPRSGEPSTVVSVVDDPPAVLREGALPAADIAAALTGDS